jgi:hypothetical protein
MKRVVRKNKPRHEGNLDLCPCCYYLHCDSSHGFLNTPFIKKRNYRLENNLCVSCGKNPCKCKRRTHKSNVDK